MHLLHRVRSLFRFPVPAPIGDEPQVPFEAKVDTIRWLDDDCLELLGWAYVPGDPSALSGVLDLVVEPVGGGRSLSTDVVRRTDPRLSTVIVDDHVDGAAAGFRALVTAPSASMRRGPYEVVVTLDRPDGPLRTALRQAPGGSAIATRSSGVVGGRRVKVSWVDGTMRLTRRPARAGLREVVSTELGFEVEIETDATGVRLVGTDSDDEIVVPAEQGRVGHLRCVLVTAGFAEEARDLVVVDASGERRPVLWAAGDVGHRSSTHGRLVNRASGVVQLDTRAVAVVQTVELTADGATVRITGEGVGFEPVGAQLTLRGPIADLTHPAMTWRGQQFEMLVALTVPGWLDAPVPAISGRYVLTFRTAAGPVVVELAAECLAELPRDLRGALHRVGLRRVAGGGLALEIGAPLHDDELGRYHELRMRRAYRAAEPVGENAVYFECYYGASVTDSGRAIHDELDARGSDLTVYWGVADWSVQVPASATAVLRRSQEWYDVLARVDYLVFNAGMPPGLLKREHQIVVQTWHGTPLKLLGLDRPANQAKPGFAERIARTSRTWDHLLAGNPYSAEIFRRAYSYDGDLLDLGYPRNDSLVDPDPAQVEIVRARLGLEPGQRLALYAPTWRDGSRVMPDLLDLDALSQATGPDWVIAVRGHMNVRRWVARPGSGGRIVDVSTYPEINDLFLAADVVVTDYSSIMFDYSVTGKPLVFYVPDLQDYRDRRRGLYFDLAEDAPGPLLLSTEDVAATLSDLDSVVTPYAERYAAWRRRFNPRDDGRAAARVVDAVFQGSGHTNGIRPG